MTPEKVANNIIEIICNKVDRNIYSERLRDHIAEIVKSACAEAVEKAERNMLMTSIVQINEARQEARKQAFKEASCDDCHTIGFSSGYARCQQDASDVAKSRIKACDSNGKYCCGSMAEFIRRDILNLTPPEEAKP